jgi:beta-N-acetylhexosaminidase
MYRRASSRVRSLAGPTAEVGADVGTPASASHEVEWALSPCAGSAVADALGAGATHTPIVTDAMKDAARIRVRYHDRASCDYARDPMDLASTCGQLIIGGFEETRLPAAYDRALRARRRGGAILFGKNVGEGPAQVLALAREIHAALPAPLLGVDQEGGRVTRLGAPLLAVPAMRTVASWGDAIFAEELARAVGRELGALGFTINFAPVVDVNTRLDNPVIGDRAFGSDARTCARFGAAWIRGLQAAGILATAKHFPGHGDTIEDSHLDLPVVNQPRDRIEAVELAPFRAAAREKVAAMMTAHVVYPAFDARPATLSTVICTELRGQIGFDGMLVSDDLQMKAIATRWGADEAAVLAVGAGCDAVLVCHRFEDQERALEALVREAEGSLAFRARCEQACRRVVLARSRVTARPLDDEAVSRILGEAASRAVAEGVARRLGT